MSHANSLWIFIKIKKIQMLSWEKFYTILQNLTMPRNIKSKDNLRNKHMFRYTSEIGQIHIKYDLCFHQISQVCNQMLVKLRFNQDNHNWVDKNVL